jgi:hypothetical protein
MKIFEKTFARIAHQHELTNGLLWSFAGEYAQRTSMQNTITEPLVPNKNREFTTNQPENINTLPTAFAQNNTLIVEGQLQFTPQQKYLLRPDEKILQGSRLPTFTLRYTKGLADSNFDVLRLNMRDSWDWGIFGDGSFAIEGGTFLNNNTVFLPDFQHFRGNQVIALQGGSTAFQLLEYYKFSHTSSYFQAHWKHDFKGWLTNQIPFLKKRQTSLTMGVNYLYTDGIGNYVEGGVGINRFLRFLRVEWWNAFGERGHIRQGIRLSGSF